MDITREKLLRVTISTTIDKEMEVFEYCQRNGFTPVDKRITSWVGDMERPLGYTVIAEKKIESWKQSRMFRM